MQEIHQQLQDTIQTIYRKSIDADQALDRLQQDQKGKFAAIFPAEAGFSTEAKRFGPYVEEITRDWQALKEVNEEEAKAALPALVKKIEMMLTTLAHFQATLSKG